MAALVSTGPAIAIVTPLYNAAAFIDQTLASVAGQRTAGDEHLVVDDGSTDGGGDLVAAKIASDGQSGLRLLRQANAGEAAAVNAGVAATGAEIVGIVNADDPILPGLLDAVREAFADDPGLAAVYPDWVMIDQHGATVATIRTLEYDYTVMLAQHMCIPGPGAFFRRLALGAEPVRDSAAAGISDFDFWLRLGLHGARMRRLPQPLASWRSHRGGATYYSQSPELAGSKIAMIDRLFARRDVPGPIRALERQAKSAAAYHAALVGLRSPGVPALRYAFASFRLLARWPADVLPHQRRSLIHLAYASLQPMSGTLHELAGPLLPPHYRRQAVLDQTFGIDAR